MPKRTIPTFVTPEQTAIVREILEMGSHTFYSEAFTRRVETAFPGLKVGYYEISNAGDFKGLTVEGLPPRSRVYGSSSHGVAPALCFWFGVSFHGAIGRGTHFRNAMEALTNHLDSLPEHDA